MRVKHSQGFLRQAGGAAAVTADETLAPSYIPCLNASDLSFNLTVVEDDQSFELCKKELPKLSKSKVSL